MSAGTAEPPIQSEQLRLVRKKDQITKSTEQLNRLHVEELSKL